MKVRTRTYGSNRLSFLESSGGRPAAAPKRKGCCERDGTAKFTTDEQAFLAEHVADSQLLQPQLTVSQTDLVDFERKERVTIDRSLTRPAWRVGTPCSPDWPSSKSTTPPRPPRPPSNGCAAKGEAGHHWPQDP